MTTEHTRLIASDRVEGTTVYGVDGDKLGTIDSVMIDKLTGQVAYASMSFGSFLGIGGKHHPLPWASLKYDTERDGYVVNIDEDRLENAPAYDTDSDPDWEDESWRTKVDSYYATTLRPAD